MTDKHVHKFRRHTYKSGSSVYFCALPDCNVKLQTSLALGKRTICWRCGDSFIMNEYSIRLAKPHCANCHKPKSYEVIPEPTIEQLNKPWIHKPNTTELNATEDLRNRLSGLSSLPGTIQGKPDDEGDI